MTDRLAAVALRVLATRATLHTAGDEDALENIDTTELPNGAICYVLSAQTYYKFLRTAAFTSALPGDESLITPGSGPGQWIAFSGLNTASFSQQISLRTNGGAVVPNPSTWSALPGTTEWTSQDLAVNAGSLFDTAFWSSTTPSSGVMTYSGPPMQFEVVADIVANNAENANAQQYGLYISQNGAGLGGTAQFVRSSVQQVPTANPQDPVAMHATSRLFLATGDTIQIAIINFGIDGDDVNVSRANLSAYPVG